MNWLNNAWWLIVALTAIGITVAFEWRSIYRIHQQNPSELSVSVRMAKALLDVIYSPSRRRSVFDRGTRTILVSGSWVGLIVAILARELFPSANAPNSTLWHSLGCIIIVFGAVLRIVSVDSLKLAAHRVVYADSSISLVTTGPYRVIRHPAYAGGLLILAGIGVLSANFVGAAACVLLPFLSRLPRIHTEERILEQVHGDAYREYALRVKRMIPGVWLRA